MSWYNVIARKFISQLELTISGLLGTSKKTSVVVGKCRLSVGYKHGWLWLYGVHVSDEHRGKGYAALAMQELVTVCDKLDIRIKLEAVPLDDDGDMKRLVGFYKRFGFKPMQSTKQAVVMERKPNKGSGVVMASTKFSNWAKPTRQNLADGVATFRTRGVHSVEDTVSMFLKNGIVFETTYRELSKYNKLGTIKPSDVPRCHTGIKKIASGFARNTPMPMPIGTVTKTGKVSILDGFTRLKVARGLGIQPKVFLIPWKLLYGDGVVTYEWNTKTNKIQPVKGTAMSLKNISHKLAAAGVKHVVVSAFPRKESVHTPEGWDAALEAFKDGVQKLQDDYIKTMDYTHLHGTKVTSEDALKFTKVFINEPGGNKRIYCFIDRNNGDILKPATFSAPAKGARGNIFDADHGMKRMGPHGPAYNK